MTASHHTATHIEFPVEGAAAEVSGLLLAPPASRFVYVLAHGAGAGMRHRFLEDIAGFLADKNVATLRYQFPYMEAGRRRPDPPHLLEKTVASAIETARRETSQLPIVAGGKSMGGRMTSRRAALTGLEGVLGLVFLGFPLHPPGKPGAERADHLFEVDLPMLFLQGTRDPFARLDLLLPVSERLGRKATLEVIEGGDHSFKVPKRAGRGERQVMEELASAISDWADGVLGI